MMRRKWAWIALIAVGLATIFLYPRMTVADDDEREHRRHGSRDEREHRKHDYRPVSNSTFVEHCGACHLAYPPELLPSGSWEKILADLDDHNGNNVTIGEADLKTISQFLKSNAADKTRSKRAGKIMRSLRGQTPRRITEVPYIRQKHHDVSAELFQKDSIGSPSNCVACHTTADQGIFDDDNVTIPK